MKTQTIQATVNPRLLQKANRLFTGTLEGRIIEILQNARRAGATEVHVTNENGFVTVRDNGQGIEDFQKLLDLGGSGWEEDIELSEDPAGVGLFCLAPREVVIRSQGKIVKIKDDGWTGAIVDIAADRDPVDGTVLKFRDEEWNFDLVSCYAVFTGLKVSVDGRECPREPFVSADAAHHPELGCRIEVRLHEQLSSWHTAHRRESYNCSSVIVNFHGQVVALDHRPVSLNTLRYLVDLTGAPTAIRLMLPARTLLVENGGLTALKAVLEVEAYRFIQRLSEHDLPYQEYLRAQALGITLPEAKPTYNIGLLTSDGLPDPVAVDAPKDFPLGNCYRFDWDQKKWDDNDHTNVHLLAALGKLGTPFVPVDIRPIYNGYSWAKLPTVDAVEVKIGKVLHEDWLWSGTLACVDSISITARTSDGRTFESPVCMAVFPPDDKHQWADATVYVTPQARDHLSASEIWYHLGGWNDDGDTYDTQEASFSNDLERFWADVIGPDEHLRQRIVESVNYISDPWQSVTISKDGAVTIRLEGGNTKLIQPPAAPPTGVA